MFNIPPEWLRIKTHELPLAASRNQFLAASEVLEFLLVDPNVRLNECMVRRRRQAKKVSTTITNVPSKSLVSIQSVLTAYDTEPAGAQGQGTISRCFSGEQTESHPRSTTLITIGKWHELLGQIVHI